MTIEHKDIPDAQLHEPKGVASALIDEAYLADGAGSGVWSPVLKSPDDLTVTRIIDAENTSASQLPSGLDIPMQITFGPSVNTDLDDVKLSSTGKITINKTGTYRIKVRLGLGRTGGAGVSELYLRALVDGTQAGSSIYHRISSFDVHISIVDDAWLYLTEGTEITYELLRDSIGNDSGGLYRGVTTPADWADSPCASIRIEKWDT